MLNVRVRISFRGRSGVEDRTCGVGRDTETGDAEVDSFRFNDVFR